MEYAGTYETALELAKNDLTDPDAPEQTIVMLDQLGSYSFARRYVLYFRQIEAVQREVSDLDAAETMLLLCQSDAGFSADLAERGLPSCSDLLTHTVARRQMLDGYSAGEKQPAAWWLRTPGEYPDRAVFVSAPGSIHEAGHTADFGFAVRPALWIGPDA